jgi:hypothetical protein
VDSAKWASYNAISGAFKCYPADSEQLNGGWLSGKRVHVHAYTYTRTWKTVSKTKDFKRNIGGKRDFIPSLEAGLIKIPWRCVGSNPRLAG